MSILFKSTLQVPNLGWQHSQIRSADRISIGTQKQPDGSAAIQFKVEPNDVVASSSGAERAEVLNMPGVDIKPGSQVFIGTRYFFPAGWKGKYNSASNCWSIVFQMHGPDVLGAQPAFALGAGADSSGVQKYTLFTNGGAQGGSPKPRRVLGDLKTGIWTDFIIGFKFAGDNTGAIQIWRRDAGAAWTQIANETGATLQFASGQSIGAHYFKQGIYRGPAAGIEGRTDTFFIGTTIAGTTLQDVQNALAGTPVNTAPPVTPPPVTPAPVPSPPIMLTAGNYSLIAPAGAVHRNSSGNYSLTVPAGATATLTKK